MVQFPKLIQLYYYQSPLHLLSKAYPFKQTSPTVSMSTPIISAMPMIIAMRTPRGSVSADPRSSLLAPEKVQWKFHLQFCETSSFSKEDGNKRQVTLQKRSKINIESKELHT